MSAGPTGGLVGAGEGGQEGKPRPSGEQEPIHAPREPPYLSRSVFKLPGLAKGDQTVWGGVRLLPGANVKKGGVSETSPRTSTFSRQRKLKVPRCSET